MRTLLRALLPAVSACLVLAGASPSVAVPLGSGFTYRGELVQNGVPVTGPVNLRFSLWDAAGSGSPPVGGSQLGASHLLTGVPVTDGVFAIRLNESGEFGAVAFNGDERWLQVEVCEDPACVTLTTLSPRQPVGAVPYALVATKPWIITGSDLSYDSGNVAIGATTPANRLHVVAGYTGDGVRLVGGVGTAPAYHLYDVADSRASLGLATSAGLWSTDAQSGDVVLRSMAGKLLLQNGVFGSALAIAGNNVGLGTPAPAARLDVRGNVKLGPSGQYFVPSGEENLRILRGTVLSSGFVLEGTGFTVSHTGVGLYGIHFPNFAGKVTALVTPYRETVPAESFQATVWTTGLGGVSLFITQNNGVLTDGKFCFIIMGPR